MSPLPSSHKDIRSLYNTFVCSSCGAVRPSILERPTISPYRTFIQPDGVASQPYQYKDIDRECNQIRLVVLYPGAKSDKICCHIVTTTLESSPSYSAAPQTWRFLPVTTNCENVLRQLRQEDQSQTIWIDSICINQSQTDEQNHQVGLMGRIYQRAKTVEICIHNPAEDYMVAM
ncbi:hypothetical protein EK21DRAFT_54431, partial [Setomelanomma holmii]